jgi:hypothetical protein
LTVFIKNDAVNVISGNAFAIRFVMRVGVKGAMKIVKHIQPAAAGTDPDISGFVLADARDHVMAQATGIFFIIFINLEFVAVVPVQPTIGPDPNEAFLILKYAINIIMQQTVFSRETFKMNRFVLSDCGQYGQEQYYRIKKAVKNELHMSLGERKNTS